MAKRFLSIKNYEEYQHYKHRNPPWVKLHLSILDDPDFLDLPDASKWHYIGLILLASRHGNDVKPDEKYIKNRLGLTEKLDLSKRFLKDHVLASNASKVLLTNSNDADSEKSRDRVEQSRVETEARCDEFEQFWEAYPNKVGKKDAERAWDKAKDKPPLVDILQSLVFAKQSEKWTKENGRFIPNPSTWLNQGRWADVHAIAGLSPPKPQLVVPKAFQKHESPVGSFEPMPDGLLDRIGKRMPTLREA